MFTGALERLRSLTRNTRVVAVLFASVVLLATVLLAVAIRGERHELRMSAGQAIGRRHDLARVLVEEAEARGISITLTPSSGSEEAMAEVASGALDIALVQGGLDPAREVREVAPLVLEHLHVLVRDPAVEDLTGLRGKSLDLSVRGSGTHALGLEVLALAGLRPGRHFTEVNLETEALEDLDDAHLPDAVFHVSSLPSDVAERLVRRHGYHLLALPMSEALAIENPAVRASTIPPYACRGLPPEPKEAIPSIATRMMLVARSDVDASAVRKLVEVVYSDRFSRETRLRPRDGERLLEEPELALHEGTVDYVRRHEKLLTPEIIDNIESLRSFFVSLAVAIFLAWRWYRTRQAQGFERYIAEVNELEREVMAEERHATPGLVALLDIRRKLRRTKANGLEAYTSGRMTSAELLSSFLLHVNDVRDQVDDLILHERERLEKKARRAGDADHEDELVAQLWKASLAED
jgi:TRAP-type uncharacterized transport system substrate-binding protein